MKVHFSVFNFLLVVLSFVFLLFSTSNNAFAAPAGCVFQRFITVPYCGQTGSLCGPSRFLNKACTGAGKGNTGDSCCTKVIESQPGTGKFYDSCSSDAFPNPGAICGPGDAVNLLEPLYCCINPTPTPTPTITPTPTTGPPPPSCSSYTTCATCFSGAPYNCGWKGNPADSGSYCESGTSSCPAGYAKM